MCDSKLQQVEKFKCREVVFTSDGKKNKEIYAWIGKTNAAWALSFRDHKTETYKHRLEFSFTDPFHSFPTVMSLG